MNSTNTTESEIEKSIIYKYYYVKRRIGKGAYGVVWKAYKKSNNQAVAIKKVFDAFKLTEDAQRTYREVIYLRAFRGHPNIIQLLQVHKSSNKRDLYLVFEFMETDLHKYISEGNKLKEGQIRYILYQLLKALKYIHSGEVIHRDLKPANILLNWDWTCKLADFGLARSLHDFSRPDPEGRLTEYVATRWYRAPEILIGSGNYSSAVDLWSLGCVLSEMVTGEPLFPGESSLHQLELMGRAAGCRRDELESALLKTVRAKPSLKWSLKHWLGEAGPEVVDLASRLLLLDPVKRLTASEGLRHPFVACYRSSEPILKGPILPKYSDSRQLSVQDYRSALYSYDRSSLVKKPALPAQARPPLPVASLCKRPAPLLPQPLHKYSTERISLHRASLVPQQPKPVATDPETTTTEIYHFPNKSVQLIQQVSYFRGNSQSKFR